MNKSLFIFSAALFSVFAFAVPLRFDAPADSTKTFQTSAYHGETLEIEAQLTWRNSPLAIQDGAEAAMCWQTNGMGDAWWTAPASVTTGGVVTATWSPSNDVGAASYRVFFRVAGPGGASYRANMLLRLLGSPGATPNSLQLPVPLLDFAKITVTNAPWGDSTGFSTNDVQAIALTRAEAEAGYTDWVCSPAAITATVAATPTPGWAPGPSREVSISFRVQRSTDAQYADYWEMHASQYCYEVHTLLDPDGTATNFTAELRFGAAGIGISPSSVVVTATRTRLRPTPGQEAAWDAKVDTSDLAPYARTDSLGTAAYKDANEFATAADEALVYQLLMGSNVVAEVTNYNSRVRAPQLRLLQLDQDTHEYITVWAETNGLTRTFNEAKAYIDATSNALDMVKADRAWSKHTSGLGADAPDGVTWISTPQTVISGGYEYERHITTHGEVWVLTSNGMGFGGDTNSYFRVSTPDGETLFSIEKTDEQIIGVQTDGISVSGAGTVTLNVGVVTYNGQAPICMAAQSVNGPWADLSEGRPAWISSVATNGVNGAWSFELESTSSAAFFYFMVKQPGATVIKNSAQTDFSGGILVEGTRFYPHKSGSTLTWTTTP